MSLSALLERAQPAHRPTVTAIQSLRGEVASHALFTRLRTLADVRVFMEHHVWAVWDFMTLLKSLQADLAPVTLPWRPVADLLSARLINEIVLGEETDLGPDGTPQSHFEIYLSAMTRAGADDRAIRRFLQLLSRGMPPSLALDEARPPVGAARFVRHTLAMVGEPLPYRAAAFALGREDIIPSMFRQLVDGLASTVNAPALTLLVWYLERHVAVDGEEHGPMAARLLERVGWSNARSEEQALAGAVQALTARRALWDAIAATLPSS